MDLIKELGLEKCKQIVDGAPAIANFYIPSKAGYTRMGSVLLDGAISLNDLRTAIASHECDHDWEDISCNGDLERQLICTYCSMKKSEPFALNEKRWSQEDEDSCVDIKNHISPSTKVIEK